jgi:hypothetical protein
VIALLRHSWTRRTSWLRGRASSPRRRSASAFAEASSRFPTAPAERITDPWTRTFGSIVDARAFCQQFFAWYNAQHYHSGIAWLHPVDVHYGRAETVRAVRAEVLNAAYARNPNRFVNKPPEPAALATAAWINKPPKQDEDN